MTKEPSEEADERQLELAKRAGDAYQEALAYMAEEVADAGGKKEVGEYIVGFAQEEAEGMYRFESEGELRWEEPDEENAHLEVAVCDADDGRFLPHVDVTATLVPKDGQGERIGPFDVPFLWHPGLLHYGKNVTVPDDGTYTVRLEVDPPTFSRHDETNGDRYAEAVEVEFEGVEVKTGRS